MTPNRAGVVPLFPETLLPGTCLGRWRVVERLGVGGQGAVYRVEDVDHPGDFYALKLALHAHHPRAEREAELMWGRAVHPQVVRLHGCARWPHPREGCLGLVMDWVPGQALDTWAEREGTTFRQLATVAATVARTLGELHARGVRHRDLKPEHILVRDADGQPVLLDFGVSWYEGAAPLTPGPLPPATPYLLSPEAVRCLWRGGETHVFAPTDDLYALGVCLYRACTGHYPFSEWMPWDVLQWALVHVRPLAPALVNPRVPRALSEVIVRLLEKDPRRRYPSGAALHAALLAAAGEASGAWDASLFDWEELPAAREGDVPERQLVRPPRPRPSWAPTLPHGVLRGPWLGRLALTAMIWVLLVSRTQTSSEARAPSASEAAWATDARVGPSADQTSPPRPYRNQKQAPCTKELEVEFSGVCWHSLVKKRPPDCPPETIAYKGECLWPVPRPPLPTSVDGGTLDAR